MKPRVDFKGCRVHITKLTMKRDDILVDARLPFSEVHNMPYSTLALGLIDVGMPISFSFRGSVPRLHQQAFVQRFTEKAQQLASHTQYLQPSHDGIDNVFNNLGAVLDGDVQTFSLDRLNGITGRRVAIVGAGPSLNDHLDKLEKVCKDPTWLVMACGSAARVLHNRGLVPDFVVACDPYYSEYSSVFSHLSDKWMKYVTLVCSLELDSYCFYEWAGHVVIASASQSLEASSYIYGHQEVTPGNWGSCVTLAANLCKEFKAGSMTLMGVDLVYKDGVRYADSSADVDADGAIEYCGQQTNMSWILEAQLLQTIISSFQGPVYRIGDGLHLDNIIVPDSLDLVPVGKILKLFPLGMLDHAGILERAAEVKNMLLSAQESGNYDSAKLWLQPWLNLHRARGIVYGPQKDDLILETIDKALDNLSYIC